MNIEECIRCSSKNIITCYVNTRISLKGEEIEQFGVTSQKMYEPTNAIICKDCGHIELLLDWNQGKDI